MRFESFFLFGKRSSFLQNNYSSSLSQNKPIRILTRFIRGRHYLKKHIILNEKKLYMLYQILFRNEPNISNIMLSIYIKLQIFKVKKVLLRANIDEREK